MGVCAELKIDLVGVVDKLLCKLLSDQGDVYKRQFPHTVRPAAPERLLDAGAGRAGYDRAQALSLIHIYFTLLADC